MEIFLYKRQGDYLVPSKEGDVFVTVGNFIVKAYRKHDGSEVSNLRFKLFGKELPLLNKLNELKRASNIEVDENYALAYPDVKTRILKLNQLIGYVFEEYVYRTLSSYFKVKRYEQKAVSLPKMGIPLHNSPDMVVEDKVAVEAKVGTYKKDQITDYEKYYPTGIVVFPWSGECKVEKWVCFYYFIKDHQRVVRYITDLLR
ncbi:hypothetical protein [Stygiolobus caldivivus]|uniref:Uncharacterized protein n=1 Tax=Stygiolobus caldivivus TaxID=2824673 RepID=A0A8D5U5V3_9CREN|nr:hypothetical protein [Stygiolobus caldivivus]BCU69429.1 hypothetical protein KN1_07260 [Stygiolobus caldivivus]